MVVVGAVRAHEPPQVAVIEHEDVIQALTADRADHPLDERILPRGFGRDEHLPNPHIGDAA